jgi:hypothetical protein
MENSVEWDLGPDCLYPAASYVSTSLDTAVKLRIDEKKLTLNKKVCSLIPVSIFTRFKKTVEEGPNKVALGD